MNKNQEQVWMAAKWAVILLTIFLAVISIKELKSISYIGRDLPVLNTISVTGKGESVTIPDIATFSFSVTENAKTVKEAQDKAATKTNLALDAIKKSGVAETDIKTLSYNINPHYDYVQSSCVGGYCPGKSVLNGYDVTQTIQVKVRDLSKAGELFGTIGSAGVQTVDSLAFSIDNIDSVKAVAREAAIKNAKAKAKEIADDLGVSLVRIINYSDSSNDAVYPMYSERSMVMSAKADATPQVPAGEQKVTSNVNIIYEIR